MISRIFASVVVAAIVALTAAGAQAAMPSTQTAMPSTHAAMPSTHASATVGYSSFHDRLAGQGSWVRSGRWGEVWRPGISGFRPYFDRGHWVYTADYGWYWDADDAWGDVVFHYGRWVFDPTEGWVWIPGYVWGPSWVVWRWGGGYAGWMPAPPDYAFLTGGLDIGFSFGAWNVGFYGYQGWYGGAVVPASLWVFVGAGHVADVNFASFAVSRERVPDLIVRTRNVTSYSVRNGFVVNRGIDVRAVERASGRPIPRVAGTTLAHSSFTPARASIGRAIAMRETRAHPVASTAIKSVHRTSTRVTGTTRTTRTYHANHYATRTARSSTVHHATSHSTRYSHTYARSSTATRTSSGAPHGASGGSSHSAPSPHPSGGHAAAQPPSGHKPGQ